MYLDVVQVAPLDTNCYLLGDDTVCAVVDAGGSAPLVLDRIRRSGRKPVMLLCTHGHYDHVRGIDGILEEYPDLPVYIHEAELCPAENVRERFRMQHHGANQRTYGEGDTLTVGDITVQVLHTPGHSAGSVVLLTEDVMLSGDTLFAGNCGRCDLPGGSMEDMMRSLRRLARLTGAYRVYPGHGSASTLEQERRNNFYMRQAMEQ